MAAVLPTSVQVGNTDVMITPSVFIQDQEGMYAGHLYII